MDLLFLGAKTLALAAVLYITNGCALLAGGKTPIDLNAKFSDGKPVLGKGKTFKGAIGGLFCGTLASALIFLGLPIVSEAFAANFLILGFLLSLGALFGDIVASFFKRRLGFERGKKVFLLDQLDFIVGGLAFGLLVYWPSIVEVALLLVLTPLFHLLGNFIAFKAKRKKVPW